MGNQGGKGAGEDAKTLLARRSLPRCGHFIPESHNARSDERFVEKTTNNEKKFTHPIANKSHLQ